MRVTVCPRLLRRHLWLPVAASPRRGHRSKRGVVDVQRIAGDAADGRHKRHVKQEAEGDERSLSAASADRAGKKPVASGSIQESLKIFVAESTTEKKKIQESSDKKWALYFKMQKTKLKAQEKKEERLLMATNTSDMSPNQKAYFVAERRRIQAEKMAAEAAALNESEEEGEEGDEEDADA